MSEALAATPSVPSADPCTGSSSLSSDGASRAAGLVELRIEHELRHTLAIAKVDEHAATVISVRLNPAGEDNVLARVTGAQGARTVGASV